MPRRHLVPALLLAVALAATGCGGGDDTPAPSRGSAAPAASDEQLNLRGSCPDTVVVQTDWDPESEYGVYYHLLGPNPQVDTERKRVSAPLVAQGKDTGVRLEVGTGGPRSASSRSRPRCTRTSPSPWARSAPTRRSASRPGSRPRPWLRPWRSAPS